MAASWKHFILLSALTVLPVISSLVTLTETGGYKQIAVAISPKVNISQIEDLLLDLEELFTEASRFQRIATRNQTSFEEVIVLLPKSFQGATLPENREVVVVRKYFSSPDIFITDETIFGNRPFTVQNSGCGERGLYIKIPTTFFNPEQDGRQLHLTDRAKVLVHEWAHYRYGVFDENGFLGDELYPLNYSIPGHSSERNLHFTACTNRKGPFVLRKLSGEKCQEFEEGCWPYIDNSEDIVSSLMYDPSLPKVNQFCDGKELDHDRDAPTKQNVLCREENTWNVISRNADFRKTKSTGGKNFSPVFKYSIEPEPKIVFVVEATENMGTNDKISQVQNAFSYFVLYDLPADSQVGIISMKSTNSAQAKPLFVKLSSNVERERLCDAFPDPYGRGDVCVHCGIRRALEVLNSDRNPSISGTVILTTTMDVSPAWNETLTQELSKVDVKLFVIFFSATNSKEAPLLEKLAVTSGGQLFMIPEKRGTASFHPPLTVLYETFRTIYGSLSWSYETDTLVTQKAFNQETYENSLSFSIDESISSFRLILTVPNSVGAFPVVKDEVILKSRNFEFRAGDPAFSYKSRIPAYVFTVVNPESGNWTLVFQKKPGITQYFAAIVRASQRVNVSITVRSWIQPLNGTGKPPGIIYAEVSKGRRPILNANVTALVLHPDLNRVSKLNLYDAGEGDPDITRNDGIYSRYFTDFSSEGYYTLALLVHYSASEDLEKRKAHEMNSSVSAHAYEIKVFSSREDALGSFESGQVLTIDEWKIHGPWLQPEPAGTIQTTIIQLGGISSGVYFLAMRAIDSSDNRADVSNVVKVYHDELPPTDSSSVTNLVIDPDIMLTTAVSESTTDAAGASEKTGDLNLIIVITCVLLLLMIIIGFVLFIWFQRYRKLQEENKADSPEFHLDGNRNASNDTLCRSESSEGRENESISVISPVASWPAETLLSHYEMVRDAKLNRNTSPLKEEQNGLDTISQTSSLYASLHRNPEKYSLMFNQMYYPHPNDRDINNYSFNPAYTSSLRRLHGHDNLSSRLNTDV